MNCQLNNLKFKLCKTFRFETDKFQYHIIYDYNSGKRNRYTVIVTKDCEPIVIGRELTLAHSKEVIKKFDLTNTPSWAI